MIERIVNIDYDIIVKIETVSDLILFIKIVKLGMRL